MTSENPVETAELPSDVKNDFQALSDEVWRDSKDIFTIDIPAVGTPFETDWQFFEGGITEHNISSIYELLKLTRGVSLALPSKCFPPTEIL